MLSFRSVPCKPPSPGKVCSKEAHQKPVDKKSTELSYGTNCWWLFNLSYPVPDQLGEFGLSERLCVMQGDFLLWHIAGVSVEGWRGLFLTFAVKNILHFYTTRFVWYRGEICYHFFWVIVARKWDDSQTETLFC